MMALSEHEQQILDDIAANLAEEDPELGKIAATTQADYTWKQRRLAIILLVIGAILMLGIALKWWLAPIGAVFVFTGMFRLLRTTNSPIPGYTRTRESR
ncbi:DUF3040 domain-containing protein [Stomatohabitans albus]|uniref:DUF3040 domain-containing protein n=1 Tax=Stomatohabitans albus TaxID=3110766 RepID=UPI00300D135C